MIKYDLDIFAKGSQVLYKLVQLFAFTAFSVEQLFSHSIADEVKFDMTAWTDACVFMKSADM